ncbi:lantibiotic dehydratase family protein [Maribacter flavus]|uniref:Lantibiotic dehydratase N-terminal domain-containing protein n=1 Tax=Maribacter flavus TaxID=1658664 RepID=A0A5B2TVW0_9FLAO|nr:lantibiotic dehydratase family protein [Maribacter flavus]KAA2218522.1 hypothetical protein F0361_02555 [Maribacter flavus]
MYTIENPYKPFPNFVLRTPIFDFNIYRELTKDDILTTGKLKEIYNNILIKDACFLASPTLYFELEKWLGGSLEPKKERKIQYSFLKYLTRMTTRCTPFGLFAGCSLGEISDSTIIENNLPHLNIRHTRLDMNYLVSLSQDLSDKNKIRWELLYFPNSSIYSSGTQLRYIEYYYIDSKRHHHIVEVDNSEYLQEVLIMAKSGAYLNDLIEILVKREIPYLESKNFIIELLDCQVLVSELEPSVSGPEFMTQIIDVLGKLESSIEEVEFLKTIEYKLELIDKQIGNNPEKYLKLSEYLSNFHTTFELKYLFQTDLELKPLKNTISKNIVDSVKRGMILLNQMTPSVEESNLSKFKDAFFERYGEREMPLSKVLDIETGLGYLQEQSRGDVNPLVDDISLPTKQDAYNTLKVYHNNILKILERKLIEADKKGLNKIILTELEFEDFPSHWEDLPDTMSSMIQIINDEGSEKIKFSGISGSSAANLIGRFCHGDFKLLYYTKSIVEYEEQMNSDKILAEIIHLPEARVGNILMRPSFRKYEIPFLAKSNAPVENQIPLSDLFISVRNQRIVLRSKTIGREVIPHLTNAHNFTSNAIPIYQFLCDMQTQNLRNGIYFNFGFLDDNRTFLPRVEFENLILHEAKWKIQNNNIKEIYEDIYDINALKEKVKILKKKYRLPQYVLLKDGDNELLVNLENTTSVQMLLDTVKNRREFILTEFLFGQDGIVKSANGYYTHQILLSFYNANKLKN